MITAKRYNGYNADICFCEAEKFELEVTMTDGVILSDEDVMIFEIAENESSDSIIRKSIRASENKFTVSLLTEEKALLEVGNGYIYRMTVTQAGTKDITYLSGNFQMNWGT